MYDLSGRKLKDALAGKCRIVYRPELIEEKRYNPSEIRLHPTTATASADEIERLRDLSTRTRG